MELLPAELTSRIVAQFNYFDPARWRLAATCSWMREVIAEYDRYNSPAWSDVIEALDNSDTNVRDETIFTRAAAVIGPLTDLAQMSLHLPHRVFHKVEVKTIVLPFDVYAHLVVDAPERALQVTKSLALYYYMRQWSPQWDRLAILESLKDLTTSANKMRMYRLALLRATLTDQHEHLLKVLKQAAFMKNIAIEALTPELVAVLVNCAAYNENHLVIDLLIAMMKQFSIEPILDKSLMAVAEESHNDQIKIILQRYYNRESPAYDFIMSNMLSE